MIKLFIVAEDKLVALADKALKLGGLAIHAEVQALISSVVEHKPEEVTKPTEPAQQ